MTPYHTKRRRRPMTRLADAAPALGGSGEMGRCR